MHLLLFNNVSLPYSLPPGEPFTPLSFKSPCAEEEVFLFVRSLSDERWLYTEESKLWSGSY